jgi:hypothetical protein
MPTSSVWINSVIAGILLGLLFVPIYWSVRKFNTHPILMSNPFSWETMRYTRRMNNRFALRLSLPSMVIFYCLGLIGAGKVFQIDFGSSTFIQDGWVQFFNPQLFGFAIVGMFWGLMFGAVSVFFDYGVNKRRDFWGYVIATIWAGGCMFWAIVLSILSQSPLLAIALLTLFIGIFITPRIAKTYRPVMITVVVTLNCVVLPVMAYLSGARF